MSMLIVAQIKINTIHEYSKEGERGLVGINYQPFKILLLLSLKSLLICLTSLAISPVRFRKGKKKKMSKIIKKKVYMGKRQNKSIAG